MCNMRQYTKALNSIQQQFIWTRQDDLPRLLCLYYQRMQQLIPRVTLPPKWPRACNQFVANITKRKRTALCAPLVHDLHIAPTKNIIVPFLLVAHHTFSFLFLPQHYVHCRHFFTTTTDRQSKQTNTKMEKHFNVFHILFHHQHTETPTQSGSRVATYKESSRCFWSQ